jgi:nitrate/nitrite-specific signal transduction histidine kinase
MNPDHSLKSGQKTLSIQIYAIFIIFVIIAFVGLMMENSATSKIYEKGFHDYQNSTKLLKDINEIHSSLYKVQSMVSSGQNKQEIAQLSDATIALLNQDVALVKKIVASDISDEQKKYYSAIMSNLNDYQQHAARALKLLPIGQGAAYMSGAEEKVQNISRLLSQLLDLESKNVDDLYSASNRNFYIVIFLLLIVLAGGVVASSFFIGKAYANVADPIQEASGILREYADGKFNRTLSWDADDEIGDLAQSVNALKGKFAGAGIQSQKGSTPPLPQASPATAPAPEPKASADSPKSLSGMVNKDPEKVKDADKLVISPKKAIDKLQDI